MHTLRSYDANDPERDDVIFHHNGDYSGDVLVYVSRDRVDADPGTPGMKGLAVVTISFEAIKDLVAEAVRSARVQAAEQASADEVLGL